MNKGYIKHAYNRSYFYFNCPGCGNTHMIQFAGEGCRWEFNSDELNPTISPSIMCNRDSETQCHSFVKDGKIQFLDDCYHKLAGQTVELPEWDNSFSD